MAVTLLWCVGRSHIRVLSQTCTVCLLLLLRTRECAVSYLCALSESDFNCSPVALSCCCVLCVFMRSPTFVRSFPYSDFDCSPVAVCSPNFVRSLCLRMLACLLLWLRTRQAESVPDTLYSCCDVSALAVFSLRCVSFRLPSIIFVQFKKCKRII